MPPADAAQRRRAAARQCAVDGVPMALIDSCISDCARVIGCWQVGDVLIDPGPESCLPTLLEALGDERPRRCC